MDKRLFDIFSEETEVPEVVTARIQETLQALEKESQDRARDHTLEKKTPEATVRFKKRKKIKSRILLVLAAAMLMGASAYAGERYFGISEFLSKYGENAKKLSGQAETMVETQINRVQQGYSIVDYEVKEAMCDAGSIYAVVEVTAKERGKYLLVDTIAMMEDPVRNIGIESDMTIGEYAASKDLTVVYVGVNFDFSSDMGVSSASVDFQSVEDDVMKVFVSAVKSNDDKNMTVSCVGTIRLPDARTVEDIMRTEFCFQLQDKSIAQSYSFVPVQGSGQEAADGRILLNSVEIQVTDLQTYVYINYTPKKDIEGIEFAITDEDGMVWESGFGYDQHPDPEDPKQSVVTLTYAKREIPEKLYLAVSDCLTELAYEPISLEMKMV